MPRHALTLWVPQDPTREVFGKCTVPGCGRIFYAGEEQAWQRHVGPCARANLDRIEAVTRQEPVFSEENWNPDAARHLRGVGRRMLAEGRMEMFPSEKIYDE